MGYFLLHLLLRLLVSNSAELDEAEQLLLTQELRLGYGSQPPLYTWLLSVFFHIFGTNIFSLAVMKNGLLFSTYLFVYLSAKEVTNNTSRAITATLSLLLIPQILWESQRDLTHSVLGTTIAACTLYVMLRMLKTGKLHYHLLFGMCAGIGIISKYNYGIFLLALLLSVGSFREFRPRLFNRRSILSLICLLLVISPHIYWIANHLQTTLAQAGKFQIRHSLGLLEAYSLGVQSLILAIVSFLGMLLPAYFIFFYSKAKTNIPAFEKSEYPALVGRILLAGLFLCVLMILFFKVTVFKDRWMQPLLFITPLYLVTLTWSRISIANTRRYAYFTLTVAVAVLMFMPGRTLFAFQLGIPSRLSAPYSALATQLHANGLQPGIIIAQNRLVGGNMKLFFPESVVAAPEIPLFTAPATSNRLLVWDATTRAQMPVNLQKLAKALSLDINHLQPQYIQAPYKFNAERSMRLGFLLVGKENL